MRPTRPARPRNKRSERRSRRRSTSRSPATSPARRRSTAALRSSTTSSGSASSCRSASKRREQIDSLKKIIELSGDPKETPEPPLPPRRALLGGVASTTSSRPTARTTISSEAMNATKDVAAQEKAKKEKAELMAQRDAVRQAGGGPVHADRPEVPGLRAHRRGALLPRPQPDGPEGEEKKALVAYKRLVEKYPKSQVPARRVPGLRRVLLQQLARASATAAREGARGVQVAPPSYPESQVYGFALYKQGWCYFNLTRLPAGDGPVQGRRPLRRVRRRRPRGEGRRHRAARARLIARGAQRLRARLRARRRQARAGQATTSARSPATPTTASR